MKAAGHAEHRAAGPSSPIESVNSSAPLRGKASEDFERYLLEAAFVVETSNDVCPSRVRLGRSSQQG